MNRNEINEAMKTIAEYTRIAEEAQKIVEEQKELLKAHMKEAGIEELIGDEHKATWKTVNSTTFDKKGIIGRLADLTKTDAEAIKKMYTLPNPSRRFTFA